MQSMKKVLWPVVAAIAIAGGSYFGSLGLTHNIASADSPAATAKPTAEPHSETIAPGEALSRAFRSVHNVMKDAVVNIQVVKKSSGEGTMDQMHPHIQLPPGFSLPPGSETIRGTGSGVIVSPDGYVLTNNHVVEDATDIELRLNDGRNLKAKVIGTDPKTDLAVVKIDADHLTYAKFGDSDATEVGDWVLAFGSPLGFSQTMTQGIISAKGRQIDIIQSHNPALQGLTYEDFLQTDAAINPGNSGGPLVNLKGEVIGINSAIASNTGSYNGIGFSIPSSEALYIMDSLIKNGKVVRGFLNVAIEDVNNPAEADKSLAEAIHKSGFAGKGALVTRIASDGPAGKGGVQAGDVITVLNGKSVATPNELRNQIARTAPGTQVAMSVYRFGKTVDLTFPVGTQPATRQIAAEIATDQPQVDVVNSLGVHVKDLTAGDAPKYHLNAGGGVLITDVDPSGLAGAAGLQSGDIILRINGENVNSTENFTAAVSKAKMDKGVQLQVRAADGMDRLVLIASK